MRKLFCLFALLYSFAAGATNWISPPQPMPWVKMTELWCANLQVEQYINNAVWGSTNTSPNWGSQSNQWILTDLSPYGVPNDSDPNGSAKFAFLSGMLIITHGSNAETANVTFTARIPGDTAGSDATQYLGQTLESQIGSGQRSNAAMWVPVKDGKIEWMYQTPSEPALYPAYSAYAVNFTLQCWGR